MRGDDLAVVIFYYRVKHENIEGGWGRGGARRISQLTTLDTPLELSWPELTAKSD